MATVLLTIVFFASAANLQFKTEIEMVDATTCSAVAERWRAFQDGMLRVIDARCAAPAAITLAVRQPADKAN